MRPARPTAPLSRESRGETGSRRLTVGQFVAAGLVGLVLLFAALTSVFYRESRATILLASERLMGQASRLGVERIERHLAEAEEVVRAFEVEAALGALAPADPAAVERSLVAALASRPQVTEVTFTHGRAIGLHDEGDGDHDPGDLLLDEGGRWQLTASWTDGERRAAAIREVSRRDGVWRAHLRRSPAEGSEAIEAAAPRDPTLHATFTVPSRPVFAGRALWSDLAFHEADAARPPAERRRVVSVQKAIRDGSGHFRGVLRVALRSDRIDELVRSEIVDGVGVSDAHRVFLCDRFGRLISRLGPEDSFTLLDVDGEPDLDGDVRVRAAAPPPAVVAALRSRELRELGDGESLVTRLEVDGEPHLLSLGSPLGTRTQGWRVGIVVPESFYLRDLEVSRRRALGAAVVMLALGALGAGTFLRALRRDLGALLRETTRLGSFEFAPAPVAARSFRDVRAAADALEQAKTALRAMGKYVPIDLVRELYESRRDPVLGGELRDVTLAFSDVEGFTSISEELPPNRLASALGAYLDAITRAIHASGGIVDKYSGDGVMALWNAPRRIESHPRRACEAVLACEGALERLFASPEWEGLAPWRTRFGIHRAEVTVGHFGAPERMSFTAMGDGVNLASRLEGLNKLYGTRILASAAVEREARGAFLFRRIDRVAVKGKREGVEIFELLARRGPDVVVPPFVARYEAALDAHFERRFADALAILSENAGDEPSERLGARCRAYLADPPPPDWSGIHVAREK